MTRLASMGRDSESNSLDPESLTFDWKGDEVADLDPREVLRAVGWGHRRLVTSSSVAGGCISQTNMWTLDDGSELFVKSDHAERMVMLQAEADGLAALAATRTIRVPNVLGLGLDRPHQRAFLACERIQTVPANADFFENFGRQLAELHLVSATEQTFGWQSDNFIGATPQFNAPHESWPAFFASQRLSPQLQMASRQGGRTDRLVADVQRVVASLDLLLAGSDEPAVIIHGDLWSGNYLCAPDLQPVLIDPAVYRGHREAEFGMLELFGNCPPKFYRAYEDVYPLASGWRERTRVYKLYHLLNHFNLFGGGYLGQYEALAREIG